MLNIWLWPLTVFKWTWNFKLCRDLLTSWIIWIPDKSQLNLKYKVWHCWFYIAILHYFVPLVKFPINVLCIVVHFVWFSNCLSVWVCDWSDTLYFFFLLYVSVVYKRVSIVKIMRCQNRGQWFMSRSHILFNHQQ